MNAPGVHRVLRAHGPLNAHPLAGEAADPALKGRVAPHGNAVEAAKVGGAIGPAEVARGSGIMRSGELCGPPRPFRRSLHGFCPSWLRITVEARRAAMGRSGGRYFPGRRAGYFTAASASKLLGRVGLQVDVGAVVNSSAAIPPPLQG